MEKEEKRGATRRNYDDRSLYKHPIDKSRSYIVNTLAERRLRAGGRYDSHGSPGPVWHNNCTESARSSLSAMIIGRRDNAHRGSCRHVLRNVRLLSSVSLYGRKMPDRRRRRSTLPEIGFAFSCVATRLTAPRLTRRRKRRRGVEFPPREFTARKRKIRPGN